jgi:alkylation response protein AidB-like acyl-CoA dehydrogenase
MSSAPSLKELLAGARESGELTLPLPGQGATALRHKALQRWGAKDLSLARIAEAHTDAVAILAEAGKPARPGTLYGVWASDGPATSCLTYACLADGDFKLQGAKQFCSGATFLEAALVTAHGEQGILLFDVALDEPGIVAQPSVWQSAAMADTDTAAVGFADVRVPVGRAVGGPNWYLTRPGFWHGAIGPAACWAGGALSLIEAATELDRKDPHSRAQVGALQSLSWALSAYLDRAGQEIDADPEDKTGTARVRALKVRHLIERACTEVLDRFGRATGPQLLAHDAQVARQHAALTLYIRQCHAERDLETIPAQARKRDGTASANGNMAR